MAALTFDDEAESEAEICKKLVWHLLVKVCLVEIWLGQADSNDTSLPDHTTFSIRLVLDWTIVYQNKFK